MVTQTALASLSGSQTKHKVWTGEICGELTGVVGRLAGVSMVAVYFVHMWDCLKPNFILTRTHGGV